MSAQEMFNSLIAAGDLDGYDADQHCYFYAQVAGVDCPRPELWGGGPPTARNKYTVAAFAQIATTGFDSSTIGANGQPPAIGAPIVTGSTGNGGAPPPASGGSGSGNLLGGLGGLLQNPIMLIVIIGLIWLLMED